MADLPRVPWRVNTSCSYITDPINLYFRRNIGEVSTALNKINNVPVLGWTDNGGSNHGFYNTNWSASRRCRLQNYQRANGWIISTRQHGRLRGGTYQSTLGYWVSAFPVHYEIISEFCGNHEVVSFNSARDYVADKFADYGYGVATVWEGNTASFQTCSGYVVHSSGYTKLLGEDCEEL